MLDTQTTAVILVGYQNDYFAADGVFRPHFTDQDAVDAVRDRTVALVRTLADAGVLLVSTPFEIEPGFRSGARRSATLEAIEQAGAFRRGSTGAALIPELAALGDRVETVHGKVHFNGFSNTRLDELLQSRGISDLLVCGMVSSLCIDSTARAGYEKGYGITILSDCAMSRTAEEQAFYCSNVFPLYAGVSTSTQALQELGLTT